jgi:hypothetical protein
MLEILSTTQKAEFVKRGISRRDFHKIATLLTAGGALPFYNEQALAQRAMGGSAPPNSSARA